jgi:DNA-binding transcriptional MerR regulator
VKISELSSRSGVTIPTIKYYIREGLIPNGEVTARNQAVYSEHHLTDLALIRALRERANLSIAAIRRVLVAVADSSGVERSTLEAGVESVKAERLADSGVAS